MKRNKTAGFTLVEVMIALAIFAVASSALIKNASLAIKQTGMIEARTIAYWIAENEFNQLRAVERDPEAFPGASVRRQSISMANRKWEVVTNIETTENKDVRRIRIAVLNEGELEDEIASLAGFLGRY